MAFQIFQVGKQRYMTENAILMAHQGSGGAQGTIENMYEMIKTFKLYIDRMDTQVAKRAGIPYETFKAKVADNMWLLTPEAVEMKLADGVVHLTGTSRFSRESSVYQYLKDRNLLTKEMMMLEGYEFVVNKRK